jgi:hypothetical protein
MSHRRFALSVALALVSATLVTGCGHDPLGSAPSPPVGPQQPSFSGDYTLTLEAASDCDSDVPTGLLGPPLAMDLRKRSYDATVTQADSRLQIALTEPRFEDRTGNSRRFSGTVTKSGANFVIGTDPAGWPSDLTERLPDGSTLQISGFAHTTRSSGVLSGLFIAYFSHANATEGLGVCGGSRFTLSPR